MSSHRDVVVIGAGVIGLSSAWKLAQQGVNVTIVDPAPGRGASWAAAGMLAPVTEAHYGEEAILKLNLRSAQIWPAFAAELSSLTGVDLSYQSTGTLAVAHDAGDREALKDLERFHKELGLDSEWLGPDECRDLEPLLATSIRGGLLARGDHQVDPRQLVSALVSACEIAGVEYLGGTVSEVVVGRDRIDRPCVGDGRTGSVREVRLQSGEQLPTGHVVLAGGWASSWVGGLPEELRPPVRPVKGQILRLRLPGQYLKPTHTVRAVSQGSSVYVVIRQNGEIVLGATVEEMGADTTVTGGGIYSLLRDAQLVFPVLLEAEFLEAIAGLRPGTPDNSPFIGPSGLHGLTIATGHFRNGILLSPVTAELVVSVVRGEPLPDWAAAFDPQRTAAPAKAAS